MKIMNIDIYYLFRLTEQKQFTINYFLYKLIFVAFMNVKRKNTYHILTKSFAKMKNNNNCYEVNI